VLKHRIADLATELECTRLLVYDVARKVDADPNQMLPREASMAKLKATEVAKRTALEGMQMMGGYGLRVGVRHGAPRPLDAGDVDLRRHQRDPARDRLEDLRPLAGARLPVWMHRRPSPHA
jgi:alkylation response protein AidB-like acyl-CoA dehydrogenase